IAFLITDNGITGPVVSNIVTSHTDVHGQMKFSNDGKKIACAIGFAELDEVFNFDNKTGKVTSQIVSIVQSYRVYGVEFSPDNSKLYVTAYDSSGPSMIIQYD